MGHKELDMTEHAGTHTYKLYTQKESSLLYQIRFQQGRLRPKLCKWRYCDEGIDSGAEKRDRKLTWDGKAQGKEESAIFRTHWRTTLMEDRAELTGSSCHTPAFLASHWLRARVAATQRAWVLQFRGVSLLDTEQARKGHRTNLENGQHTWAYSIERACVCYCTRLYQFTLKISIELLLISVDDFSIVLGACEAVMEKTIQWNLCS